MNNQRLNKKIELSGHEQRMPGIPLVGRQGIPFLWNPFSSMLLPGSIRKNDEEEDSSFNVCIAGCPGSGKTTFIEQMIDTVVGVGGRVFVFDKGNSFKSICERLKGQHIELDASFPIGLNPFSSIPIDDEYYPDVMLKNILFIFDLMMSLKQETSELENIYLQQAIDYSWEKYGNKSSVDTVKEYLDDYKDDAVASCLGQALYPFSSLGFFGNWFKDKGSDFFKEKLVVVEMERLQDNQTLMTLITHTLLIQILQEMVQGDSSTPFLIIIEEPWQFIEEKLRWVLCMLMQEFRTYKCGIVLSTRDLNDYCNLELPLACASFETSAWHCIFEQQADTIDSLKRYPKLPGLIDNKRKEALLYSLHSQLPEYSEVAIYDWNNNAVVGRLHLDSQGNPLYFPDPKDYWQMEKDTHTEDICEESSFQELKYATNAQAYRLIQEEEFKEQKQKPANSVLPLPTKEISALGWVMIIGFISLIPVMEAAKFYIDLPVIPADSVWKLLVVRGSGFILAAFYGIVLGGLSQSFYLDSRDFHLKTIKTLDKIVLFIAKFFIRLSVVLCLAAMAMKCSLKEFEQSACFDWDQVDGWLCEGTLMLIINSILWLFVLTLIAYVTSRPRFVAPVIGFFHRYLCKEVK